MTVYAIIRFKHLSTENTSSYINYLCSAKVIIRWPWCELDFNAVDHDQNLFTDGLTDGRIKSSNSLEPIFINFSCAIELWQSFSVLQDKINNSSYIGQVYVYIHWVRCCQNNSTPERNELLSLKLVTCALLSTSSKYHLSSVTFYSQPALHRLWIAV